MPSPAAATGKQDAEKITAYLTKTMNERIMVLDGAMGTTIQQYKFTEADFRGDKFCEGAEMAIPAEQEVKGNNDLLVFTQPDTIRDIHYRYFDCGADICETNTFSGTVIAQADYAMEHVVYEMNKIACELAVDAAKEITAREPHRPRLVAGAIGPTNRTLSISPSVEDPGYRNCNWDEVVAAYKQQVSACAAAVHRRYACHRRRACHRRSARLHHHAPTRTPPTRTPPSALPSAGAAALLTFDRSVAARSCNRSRA